MIAADNEELDALVARLEAFGPREGAAAITALRARVAELQRLLELNADASRKNMEAMVAAREADQERAESAESQLQQVKADAEQLCEALEYWMPDEILVKFGEELEWDRHIKLIQTISARRNDGTA